MNLRRSDAARLAVASASTALSVPPASVVAWRKPAGGKGPGLVAKSLVGAILAVLLALYLGGFLFLYSIRADVRTATPLTLIRYWHYYGDMPRVRERITLDLAIALAVTLATIILTLIPRRRSLHGDARFARTGEIRRAGLLADHGILLGKIGAGYLTLAGQQGIALAAPPRSGKGTGVVVPNLLNWPGSVFCIDIKRENWSLTAGFRRACGQACYLFDPFAEDHRTARWNPFSYVSAEPERRLNDLQRIAEMLYPDPPNVDPFWTASARSLFLGIALYLFESPSLRKTIGEVLRQGMASDDEGFGQHWKRIIEGRRAGEHPLSAQCVQALYDVIDLAPVTASSIRKTFTSRLDLWLNPLLDAATSASDFDLRDLRKKPMSIYVGVNPDDLHRLRPVLSLLCQQAIGLQTRELPEQNPLLHYQVMMMLDEFTALGRIPIIAEAISYLPGYNVRVVLVIQTPAQLREVYGAHNAETMLKSLAARIVFAPKDFSDAKEISDELGFTTVKVKTVSKPLMSFDSRAQRSRSINVAERPRPLLLPQEVKELPTEEAIIFSEGLRPIRCKKIRYFSDRMFKARLLPPPATPAPGWQPTHLAPPEVLPVKPLEVRAGAASMSATAARGASAPVACDTREAEPADVERIEELALEDFAVDFSQIKIPDHEGALTGEELIGSAYSFVKAIGMTGLYGERE